MAVKAKVKVRKRTDYLIEYEEPGADDTREFKVEFKPVDWIDPLVVKLSDGGFVVGYLSHDDDCEAPLKLYDGRNFEPDGSGKIYRMDRDSTSAERREGAAEIGYDEYGSRDEELKPNPLAVMLDKFDHSQVSWSVAGDRTPDQWDTSRCAGIWVPDDACLEHIKSVAIEKCLPEGVTVSYESKYHPDGKCITRPPRKNEKPYFKDGTVEDRRYNNVITITYPDGTKYPGFPAPSYKRFTSFPHAWKHAAKRLGIKLDKETVAKGARAAAVECARQACESYTDWCNGNCFGRVVEVFNEEGKRVGNEEACWGFIGDDYAKQQMEEDVEAEVKRIEAKLTKKA